ncbi:MAG: PRC-barrel domain-containing protein [Candidatus Bathyarchaeia archaeon]|nr:PRC-barrel domain-containing protein [Thermoproteota archaeon]MDT8781961.1 PRC-barrel domain-containing protein [Candidatus Bathyarchaeota archaeon]
MKFSEILNKNVTGSKGFLIGKVKDIVIDEDWKVTHLDIELTKEASEEILGVKPNILSPTRNTLSLSALKKGDACCTEDGINLNITKGQAAIYLRPA